MAETTETLDDLFATLTFSRDLEVRAQGTASQSISANKARDVIKGRLGAFMAASSLAGPERSVIENLVTASIVRSLPAEMMTEPVIGSLDLRPYLDVVVNNVDTFRASLPQYLRDNKGFAGVIAPNMQAALGQAQADAERIARETSVSLGQTNESALAKNAQSMQTYSPTTVGLAPEAKVGIVGEEAVESQLTDDQTSSRLFDDDGSVFADSVNPTFDESGIVQLMQLPAENMLTPLMEYEAQFNADAGTPGQMRGGVVISSRPTPSGVQTKKLSYADALLYLDRMSPDEYTDMQRKLGAAGFYDQVGAAPLLGDRDDRATQAAWQLALVESKTGGDKPVIDTVRDRAKVYREQMQQARLASMAPVDTAMVTGIGNEALTKLVGRQMTVQEADMLASYLDQLREERAGFVIGDLAGNADVTQGIGENGLGFDENDVMSKISSIAAPELAGATGFDSAQAIWKGFGMDPIDPAEMRAWRQANAPTWKTNREDY
jgi:hypothetical protein